MLERDEYVETVVDVLELLPPGTLIERLGGEAPPQYFLGPAWALDKPGLKNALDAELKRRGTGSRGEVETVGQAVPDNFR